MPFQLEPYNRNVTDDELIADVQRIAYLLGKDTTTIEEQNEHGRFHATTLIRRFGNWNKALAIANLRVGHRINIPEEELFEEIQRLWIALGRQPSIRDLKAEGKFGGNTYTKRFGSWRKALEEFVAYADKEENSPSEATIKNWKVKQATKHKTPRDINLGLRHRIMERDNLTCQRCNRSRYTHPSIVLHVDHIKPWANGGETVLENLQTLCFECNIGKSDREPSNNQSTEVQNV